jgi:hypothetical protein
MINEIMDVPFPRAASSRLINFFTFHISIFCGKALGQIEGSKVSPGADSRSSLPR